MKVVIDGNSGKKITITMLQYSQSKISHSKVAIVRN